MLMPWAAGTYIDCLITNFVYQTMAFPPPGCFAWLRRDVSVDRVSVIFVALLVMFTYYPGGTVV